MKAEFNFNGQNYWIDKSEYDLHIRFNDFREFCMHAWYANGCPTIKFENGGKDCVFPDGFTINIDTFDKI